MAGDFVIEHETPQALLVRIDERQRSSASRIEEINHKLDRLVSKDSFDGLAKRVDNLEGSQKWLLRSIITSIIAAVVGLFVYGKSHGAP